MGRVLDGAVEVRRDGTWEHVTNHGLNPLPIPIDTTASGCLFGYGRVYGFPPVVERRDLPEDLSVDVVEEFAAYGGWLRENVAGVGWATWPELAAIDWEVIGSLPDDKIHEYRRRSNGTLEYLGRYEQYFSWEFEQTVGSNNIVRDALGNWIVGQEWVVADRVYRTEWLTRREAVGEEWRALFAKMGTLAEEFGDENVRLVFWYS